MKKIIFILGIVFSVIHADQTTDLRFGVGEVKAGNEAATSFGIGFGGTTYLENNFILGLVFNFSYADIKINNKDENLYGYSSDMKLGYSLHQYGLDSYIIGSALYQSIGSINGVGVGYGAGIDYRFTEEIALVLEYKTYDITTEKLSTNYTYDLATGFLKFIF